MQLIKAAVPRIILVEKMANSENKPCRDCLAQAGGEIYTN
jgi:hypothetical protein